VGLKGKKRKEKKNIVLPSQAKFEEQIYKKNITNDLSIYFYKINLKNYGRVLIQLGSKNMLNGYNQFSLKYVF
jgi:hypothetical protein